MSPGSYFPARAWPWHAQTFRARRRELWRSPGSTRWQDFKAVGHPLAAPIALHLLWTEEETSETASRLRFATGHALRKLEVSRPSDLEAESLGIEPHELVYFLRFVCVPNILDLTRLFSGTRAILEERQAICGLLARIDPVNLQEYQDEIIMIANDLELDEGRWIVDPAGADREHAGVGLNRYQSTATAA